MSECVSYEESFLIKGCVFVYLAIKWNIGSLRAVVIWILLCCESAHFKWAIPSAYVTRQSAHTGYYWIKADQGSADDFGPKHAASDLAAILAFLFLTLPYSNIFETPSTLF